MNWLKLPFFHQHPVTCARDLIGREFHWYGAIGRIVETEAYAAEGDEACHTWFRPSSRAFVAKHDAGDAYIYLNYGAHWMFNVLVKGKEEDGFVLFRALEVVRGIEEAKRRRGEVRNEILAAGPGRLTKAFGIDRSHHGQSVLEHDQCGFSGDPLDKPIAGPRIGISRATDLLWRFGDPESSSLSKRFPKIENDQE